MKGVVVDTNVVLSLITDRDLRQQSAASRFFGKAAAGELQIVLPQVVLVEIVYVLANLYRRPGPEIAALLGDLLAMPHLAVEDRVPWDSALRIWPQRVRDFADGVLVAVAKAGNHAFASFDRKLTRRVRRLAVESYPL